MPTNRTFSPGAMTSRMPLSLDPRSSARLGRPDDVAAGFLVRLELDEILLFRILEKVGERLVAIVGLVEARIAALQRLLHHRAPDFFLRAALGDERFQGAEHQVETLLLLLLARAGGARRFPAFLCGAALLLVLPHQVVVVDELVAVVDQQVGTRVL